MAQLSDEHLGYVRNLNFWTTMAPKLGKSVLWEVDVHMEGDAATVTLTATSQRDWPAWSCAWKMSGQSLVVMEMQPPKVTKGCRIARTVEAAETAMQMLQQFFDEGHALDDKMLQAVRKKLGDDWAQVPSIHRKVTEAS